MSWRLVALESHCPGDSFLPVHRPWWQRSASCWLLGSNPRQRHAGAVGLLGRKRACYSQTPPWLTSSRRRSIEGYGSGWWCSKNCNMSCGLSLWTSRWFWDDWSKLLDGFEDIWLYCRCDWSLVLGFPSQIFTVLRLSHACKMMRISSCSRN